MDARERNQVTVQILLALVWCGVLAGVSFLATPVKFLAPSLSLPVALDVGRQTFAALNILELVLGMALLATAMLRLRTAQRAQTAIVCSFLLLALVLLQTLWLLPVLDARVETILQGSEPPASSLHLVYIGVDVIKLGLAGVVAGVSLGRLRRG